jgi:hypothetical protein
VGIPGKIICRAGIDIGEIAPSPAGNEDLFADSLIVFQNQNRPSAFTCFDGTHQSSRSATNYYDVVDLQG